MQTPRIRVRTNPPAMPAPAPRVRVRTVAPDLPERPRPAPATVPAGMAPAALCTLGEIVPHAPADRWHGWPNGSAVMGKMGQRTWHKGRHLPVEGGGFHVLRWNQIKIRYEYVRRVNTHAEALAAL